jgi:outer membrane protein OmpA-like peptidoglycan-associated protein
MRHKILLFLLITGFSCYSYAQNGRMRLENSLSNVVIITGEGGITLGRTDYPTMQLNYLGKGSIEYVLSSESSSNLALRLSGGMGYLSGSSSVLRPSKLNTAFNFFGGGLTFLTQATENVFPYVSLGVSLMSVYPRDNNGNDITPMFKLLALNGDLGVHLMINRAWSINVGTGAITGANDPNDDKFDGLIKGAHKDWIFTGTIGISYFIGRDKDSDGDGVYDSDDMCPNTPQGVKVDQFGCPIDSDGDGVPDYLDKCPNTQIGVKVDADGCPLDSDRDGVPDYLDKCPDTPLRVQIDTNGCPLDSDGDGVPDYLDKCPSTPPFVKVDINGCPLDSDGDGVPDYLDKCPNTPHGVKVDANGCPIGSTKEISKFILGVDAAFNSGKADLLPGAYPNLIAIAATLKEHPDYKAIVNGYTDSVGKEEANLILSEKRARAVVDYLVSQGIDRSRLEIRAHGEADPVAPNDTEAGRAQNRRVDIRIISVE